MLDVTPQERMALTVLAVLLTSGAVARHFSARADARAWLEYTAERADTLNPNSNPALRERAEAELAEQRLRERPLEPGEKIDPNTAPAIQLDRLPGVGPALADRIVAHRGANGRFRSLDDLDAVSGIGPALLQRITEHVTLGRAPPARTTGVSAGSPGSPGSSNRVVLPAGEEIDINRADADELQTISGIGPAIAARIVEYRDENGRFRSWEELENVSGIGPRLRERIQGAARLGN